MTDEHRRILIVDDEPQITRVLRTTLSSQGYDIRVANDGEMALELMKNWTPHVVITDLAMPNLDGVGLCRQLRQISQVPIIVLSVRGLDRSKVEALDAGADDYVTKPFSMNELQARIRAQLRRSPAIEGPLFRRSGCTDGEGGRARSPPHAERVRPAGVPCAAPGQSGDPPCFADRDLGTE
jgi:DNA-binding response OmpR family regulator